MRLCLLVTLILVVVSISEAKKKKKSKKPAPLFDTKSLNCLVCKSLVEEIEAMIHKVDPRKKVEVGTFRLSGDGTQEGRTLIPYSRSNEHLSEVVDTVCKGFEDYAQATAKASGQPTLIRLMTHQGNMNPRMSEVDIVPDDDLNTRLKFYCENIVEDQEETILQMFAKEGKDMDIELCSKRTSICDPEAPAPEEYEFENDEL